MVLAIAALFLQFAPAAHALPDITAAIPVVKAAAAAPTGDQSKSATLANSTSTAGSATGNAVPAAFTLAKLESSSQNGQALDTIRVPEASPAKPAKVIFPETHPRKAWLLLSIAEHSAATFDAYSTRLAVSKGANEADPMMQPFAHSPAMYGAIQVCPLVLDFAARRMERSQHGFLRKAWWVPQTAATGIFLFSGAHNMSVANSIR
jgi:hypothetical protein